VVKPGDEFWPALIVRVPMRWQRNPAVFISSRF